MTVQMFLCLDCSATFSFPFFLVYNFTVHTPINFTNHVHWVGVVILCSHGNMRLRWSVRIYHVSSAVRPSIERLMVGSPNQHVHIACMHPFLSLFHPQLSCWPPDCQKVNDQVLPMSLSQCLVLANSAIPRITMDSGQPDQPGRRCFDLRRFPRSLSMLSVTSGWESSCSF